MESELNELRLTSNSNLNVGNLQHFLGTRTNARQAHSPMITDCGRNVLEQCYVQFNSSE